MSLYRPPAPVPLTPLRSLARVIASGERDLLSLVPEVAYREQVSPLGYSRRGILVVNAPDLAGRILANTDGIFPKNDLMVGALEGLVGNSMFVSDGHAWRRQRQMIDPAFSAMRIGRAFDSMAAGVDAYETTLDDHAAGNRVFSLDAAMSHLTADIICRTIFSRSLAESTAREVFHDFAIFERSVANVELGRLIFGKPFARIVQPPVVRAACERIRGHIRDFLAPRLAKDAAPIDDIVGAVIAARDAETGAGFTMEELIDQIGVFFLAGHETTASVLTWVFFILSQQPETVARMREEIARIAGDGPVELEHTKRLVFVRNVFREVMRLYPPITFLPRVAAAPTTIGPYKVRRGTMVMIAPWTIHRNAALWRAPDRFDPDRWSAEREGEIVPGAYMPFGLGPRICVGAAFATIESVLILARLIRRYDWTALSPATVRPAARLTTRPSKEIQMRVVRRA